MIGANLGAKALTQPVSDWVTPKIEERIAGTVEKTLEKKGQESGQTLEELLPDSLKGLLDRTGLLAVSYTHLGMRLSVRKLAMYRSA